MYMRMVIKAASRSLAEVSTQQYRTLDYITIGKIKSFTDNVVSSTIALIAADLRFLLGLLMFIFI